MSATPPGGAPDGYDALIQAIYDCALHPDGWNQTLEQIRILLDASAINLIGLEMASFDNPFLYSSNIPADYGKDYRAYWYEHDPWVLSAREQRLATAGATMTGRMLLDEKELLKSEFYHDWLAKQDIKDVLCTNLWGTVPDMPHIILCFFRPPGAEGFQHTELDIVRGLSRHLNRAFGIAWQMGLLQRGGALRETVLDGLRQAVFLLDAQRQILEANPAGRAMLAARNTPLVIGKGRLTGLGLRAFPGLDAAFGRADQGAPVPIAFASAASEAGEATGQARLIALTETAGLGLPTPRVRYLLLIEPTSGVDAGALSAFAGLYRLTPAELKILEGLVADETPEEIAARLNVGITTVRTHLKHLRLKTGARRLSGLVRIALASTRSG